MKIRMKIPESTQSLVSILLSIGLIAFVVEWNVVALVGSHDLETALVYTLVYFLLPTAIILPVLYFALLRPLREQHAALRDALRELESQKLALDQHAIVSIADMAGKIIYVNEKFCELSQYARAELLGQNHRILNSGYHPPEFFTNMWETIASGRVWQGEVRNRSKDGNFYWMESTIVPFLDESGLPYQYVSIRTDITSIKQVEQMLSRSNEELEALVYARTDELAQANIKIEMEIHAHRRAKIRLSESEEIFRSISSAAQDAIVMVNDDGEISYWNNAAVEIFGYSREEVMGRNLHQLLAPARYLESQAKGFAHFRETGEGDLVGKVSEIEALRRDGTEFPIELSLSAVRIKDKWSGIAIVRDITERRRSEAMLRQLATTDALTGIFNRRQFNISLEAEIRRAQRYPTPLALILFDIDHFKRINDVFGHPVGDQVLKHLADLVRGKIREHDIFARWGGEEFVILTPGNGADGARELAEKLRKEMEKYPFPEAGTVTSSFGVSGLLADDKAEDLLKRVDEALYQAKEMGRNRVEAG